MHNVLDQNTRRHSGRHSLASPMQPSFHMATPPPPAPSSAVPQTCAAHLASAQRYGEPQEADVVCDGSDTRCVGVADARVFSALRPSGAGTGAGDHGSAFMPAPDYPSAAARISRGSATTSVLTRPHTPARSSFTGTPVHNTSYESDSYNRLLSQALLGRPDERGTGVFSFPMRSPPVARVRLSEPRSSFEKEEEGDDALLSTDVTANTLHCIGDTTWANSAGRQDVETQRCSLSTTAVWGDGHSRSDAPSLRTTAVEAKNHTDGARTDSLSSSATTPRYLITSDSKGGDEDENPSAEGNECNDRDAAPMLSISGSHAGSDDQRVPPPASLHRTSMHTYQRHHDPSLPTAIAAPLSYFQNAPSVSTAMTATAASALRLRFPDVEDADEALTFLDGTASDRQRHALPGMESACRTGVLTRPGPGAADRKETADPADACGVPPPPSFLSVYTTRNPASPAQRTASTPDDVLSRRNAFYKPLFSPNDPMPGSPPTMQHRAFCTPPFFSHEERRRQQERHTRRTESGSGGKGDGAHASPWSKKTHAANTHYAAFHTPSRDEGATFLLPDATSVHVRATERGSVADGDDNDDDSTTASDIQAAKQWRGHLSCGARMTSPLPQFSTPIRPTQERSAATFANTIDFSPSLLSMRSGTPPAGTLASIHSVDAESLPYPSRLHAALPSTRPYAASPFLSTPVYPHENSLRSATHHGGVGRASRSFSALSRDGFSPYTRLAVSPTGAATPLLLSPAPSSMRFGGTGTGTEANAASMDANPSTQLQRPAVYYSHHETPMVHLPRSGSSHNSPQQAPMPHGPQAQHPSSQQRDTAAARRDTFRFQRAMTANESSMEERHSPLQWGCFGVLVAQPTEVWCVGKEQPFRIFPNEKDATALVFDRENRVTAVASTEQLSLAAWEAACAAEELFTAVQSISPQTPTLSNASGIATTAAAPAAATTAPLVYFALGTSNGDVCVYAYTKCTATTPGATPVALCDGTACAQTTPSSVSFSTHMVRLQQCGTLRCADRVGVDDAGTPLAALGDPTISVLRLVGHWLYIGDQAGHVARYDLQHTAFLKDVDKPVGATMPWEATTTGRNRSPASAGAHTPARMLVAPIPGMPVHRFVCPSMASSASSPGIGAATRASPTASLSQNSVRTSPLTPPATTTAATVRTFHAAVNVREPVYHLEVTANHGYLAVGTQSRLLVYRVAAMPRIPDHLPGGVAGGSSATPSPVRQAFASWPSFSTDFFGSGNTSVLSGAVMSPATLEPAAQPVVVVADAAHPVRCFAWMLYDYEGMAGAGASATTGGAVDGSCCDAQRCDAGLSKKECWRDCTETMRPSPSSSTSGWMSMPSLIFASSQLENTPSFENDVRTVPTRSTTSLQLYRLATQAIVASCTLDYPIRFLKVLKGTAQLIVGTGAAQESLLTPNIDASMLRAPATRGTMATVTASTAVHLSTPPAQTQPALDATPYSSIHNSSNPSALVRSVSSISTMNPTSTALSPGRSPAHEHVPLASHRLTAAAVAAHRTLAGNGVGAGGVHRAATLRSARAGASNMIVQGTVGGGAAAAVSTDEGSAAMRRARQASAASTEGEHGYLFKFEVCPCETDADVVQSAETRVCLRARGETVLGTGESAVCGAVHPAQDRVCALVRPTSGSGRRDAGAAATLPEVKLKIWHLSPVVGSAKHAVRVSASFPATSLGMAAHTMDSLR